MGMFDKKKPEKVVVYKEDKKAAEARRKAAQTKLQQEGKEATVTRKGVGHAVAKTEKGRKEQAAREKINKAVKDGVLDHDGVTKKGFKSVWD